MPAPDPGPIKAQPRSLLKFVGRGGGSESFARGRALLDCCRRGSHGADLQYIEDQASLV